MAGIRELKSTLNKHGGISRLCKYEVDFSGMSAKIPAHSEHFRNLTYLLEGVNLPGKTISSVKYSLWDKPIDLPTAIENQELTLDFMMPNDHWIRNMFYAWVNKIIDPSSQLINYYNDYTCDMTIKILNDANVPGYEISCTGVYPLSYSASAFSATSTEYEKLSVTFAYHKMTEIQGTTYTHTSSGADPDLVAEAEKRLNLDGPDWLSGAVEMTPDGKIISKNLPPVVEAHLKTQELFGNSGILPGTGTGNIQTGAPIDGNLSGPIDPPSDTFEVDQNDPNLSGTSLTPASVNDPNIPAQRDVGAITQKSTDPVSGNIESQTDFNRGETTNVPGSTDLTRSQKDQKIYDTLILGPNPEAGVTYARGRSWIATADQWEGGIPPSDSFNNENEP